MTTKKIKFSNGITKEMTFDEVEKQFSDMLNLFANNAIRRMTYNKPEKQDVLQELRFELWQAYERYDHERAVFSTYAHYRLKLAIVKVVNPMFAKKRINIYGEVSINDVVPGDEGDVEIADAIGFDDSSFDDVEFQVFVENLEKQLTESEKVLLQALVSKKEISITQIGQMFGITRQAANKRMLVFKDKLAKILIKNGYAVA